MSGAAVIPARGGSKGIIDKNLKKVGGVSLVGRAVRAARASQSIDRVFVSTDSERIAAEARAHGAEVIERPADIAGSTASSESAVLHALAAMQEKPDWVCFIQCTSPFIRPADLDGAFAKAQAQGADCAFAARPFHGFFWEEEGGEAVAIDHDVQHRKRRQDLTPRYLETGAFYWMRREAFEEAKTRFCGKRVLYPVHDDAPLEIDEPFDLALCRLVAPAFDRGSWVPPQTLKRFKALALDFDGVLTNDRAWVDESGNEMASVSRRDGMGLSRLAKLTPLKRVILSTEVKPIVAARAKKLGIECAHGLENKLEALRAWASEQGVAMDEIIFVGNDLNDKGCLEEAGLGLTVLDAHPEALALSDGVIPREGGKHAVRWLCDRIIEAHSAALA